MSGMIRAGRRDVRTVTATGPGADRRCRSRRVDWGNRAAIRLRLCGFHYAVIGVGEQRDWAAELLSGVDCRQAASELLTVRHCGHRCAGPFVARNLEA
jgi:hypothetical protein